MGYCENIEAALQSFELWFLEQSSLYGQVMFQMDEGKSQRQDLILFDVVMQIVLFSH